MMVLQGLGDRSGTHRRNEALTGVPGYGKQQKLPQTTRPGGQGKHAPPVQIEVPLQARLQTPQLSWSTWRSTQAPSQHRCPAGQALPQPPQWRSSSSKSRMH
jgi:hypothetical protein